MAFFDTVDKCLAAKLGECISRNESLAKDVEAIAELVTLDGDTGFYNNQGFFKKLDEEFGVLNVTTKLLHCCCCKLPILMKSSWPMVMLVQAEY